MEPGDLHLYAKDVLSFLDDWKPLSDLCKLIAFDTGKSPSELAEMMEATSKIELSPDLGSKLATALEAGRDIGIDWLDDLFKSSKKQDGWVCTTPLLDNLQKLSSIQIAQLSLMSDASYWSQLSLTGIGLWCLRGASYIAAVYRDYAVDAMCNFASAGRSMLIPFPLRHFLDTKSPLCETTMNVLMECRSALDQFLQCAPDDVKIVKKCATVFKQHPRMKEYILSVLRYYCIHPSPQGALLLRALGIRKKIARCEPSIKHEDESRWFAHTKGLLDNVITAVESLGREKAMGLMFKTVLDDMVGDFTMERIQEKNVCITRDADSRHILDFYNKMAALGNERMRRNEEGKKRKRMDVFTVMRFQSRDKGSDSDIEYTTDDGELLRVPQFIVDWAGKEVKLTMSCRDVSFSIIPVQGGRAAVIVSNCQLRLSQFRDALDAVLCTMERISIMGPSAVYSMCKAVSQCIICSRELINKKSVEKGVGPVCATTISTLPRFRPALAPPAPTVICDLMSRLDPNGLTVVSGLAEVLEGESVSARIAETLMPNNVSCDDVSQAMMDLDIMEQTRFRWIPPTARRRVVTMLMAPHILPLQKYDMLESVFKRYVAIPTAISVATRLF